MLAFKGFNKDFTCTLGKGAFQYEIGKVYTEKECKTAEKGFHCVEEPLAVLHWYNKKDDRFAEVIIGGDINEDGSGTRIAATIMKIKKEITKRDLYRYEVAYIMRHPKRELVAYKKDVAADKGEAGKNEDVIVIGKKPIGRGDIGARIYLMQKIGNVIVNVKAIEIDGKRYKALKWYGITGDAE